MADMYAQVTPAREDVARSPGLRGCVQGYEHKTFTFVGAKIAWKASGGPIYRDSPH